MAIAFTAALYDKAGSIMRYFLTALLTSFITMTATASAQKVNEPGWTKAHCMDVSLKKRHYTQEQAERFCDRLQMQRNEALQKSGANTR